LNNKYKNVITERKKDEMMDFVKEKLNEEEKPKTILEKLLIKIEAGAWVGLSVFIIYYSNFFRILFHHENINE